MTFDFHFDDGRHEKHSNWTMWSFAMLMIRHYGVWSEDQLEAELTQLAMKKTSQGQQILNLEKVQVGEDGEDGAVRKDASASTAKRIEKYMRGKTITISVEQIGEAEEDGKRMEAYGARIELRNLNNTWTIPLSEAPKYIQDHFSETKGQAVEWAIESTKLTKRLVDLLMEVKTPMKDDLFVRLLSNDGLKISPVEAQYLAAQVVQGFRKFMTDQNKESIEILGSRFVAVAMHFGYAAGSRQYITVY